MWGTSLAWWANINYPDNIKSDIIDLLFSQQGLQLDIVRYNLGGGYDENIIQNFRKGADIPCIQNKTGNFDLNNDKYQIDILNRAISKGVNKVELFSNSPPYWMCNSGVTNGNSIPFVTNLKTDHIDDFVTFLTKSFNIFNKTYPVVSLAPFNEPSNPFWSPSIDQEGSYYDYSLRTKIIQKLKNNGIPIASADEFSALFALIWSVNSSDELIDKINIHSYKLKYKELIFYFDDWDIWRKLIRYKTEKPIWISEFGWGYNDNYKDSIKLARHIHRDLDTYRPSGWVYWQAVENMHNNNWGLLQVDFNTFTEIKILKQYYIYKHFTTTIKDNDIYTIVDDFIIKVQNNKELKYIIINDTPNTLNLSSYYKGINISYGYISNSQNDYTKIYNIPSIFPEYTIMNIFIK